MRYKEPPGSCRAVPFDKKLDNAILQGTQIYVEVSADEGHALVGYRHFADEQALNDFLERQGKAF